MKAYIFPGQGAQFPGMGKDLFENSKTGNDLFNICLLYTSPSPRDRG